MNDNPNIEFGTFERKVLSEKIAGRLLSMIQERQLRPGDRLPPERELASIMDVSRPSLREALRALSIMGIIEHRQGSGTYITSLQPSRLIEHIVFILSIDDSTFFDLFEARQIVEGGLTRLAAIRITDDQIEELENIMLKAQKSISKSEDFLQADIEFHQLIADSANNNILSIFMRSISELSTYSRQRTVKIPGVREKALKAHQRILTAVKNRDPEEAADAMQEHIKSIEESLNSITEEDFSENN